MYGEELGVAANRRFASLRCGLVYLLIFVDGNLQKPGGSWFFA
jgi:hypothetical protein